MGDQDVRLDIAYHVRDGLDLVLRHEHVVVFESQVAQVFEAEDAAGLADLLQLLLDRLLHQLLHVDVRAGLPLLIGQFPVVRPHSRGGDHRRHRVAPGDVVREGAAGLVEAVGGMGGDE